MLILGLLLLACTAAFVGLVIADNLGGGAEHNVTVLGHHIATMNGLAIFCAGLALALIFGLGLVMTAAGAAMRRRKGRKLRTARRDADATARERDELAARLDRVHAEHTDQGRLAADREQDYTAAQDFTAVQDVDGMAADGGASRSDAGAGRPNKHRTRHLFGH